MIMISLFIFEIFQLFGWGQQIDIYIKFADEDTRKKVQIRNEEGRYEENLLYFDGESVSGEVTIKLRKRNQKYEHQGIRVDFIGQIGNITVIHISHISV